jgi:hypothetical protein
LTLRAPSVPGLQLTRSPGARTVTHLVRTLSYRTIKKKLSPSSASACEGAALRQWLKIIRQFDILPRAIINFLPPTRETIKKAKCCDEIKVLGTTMLSVINNGEWLPPSNQNHNTTIHNNREIKLSHIWQRLFLDFS